MCGIVLHHSFDLDTRNSSNSQTFRGGTEGGRVLAFCDCFLYFAGLQRDATNSS